ncbi:MAG: General stress protein 26 [Chloroflexi bacterium]|nr:MAG: General stress protein 26 [Chloroflexota bacterium]
MIGTTEQDEFIRDHLFAVVTTLRKNGSPSSSGVFVVIDGDDITFSTTEDRLKTRTIENDARVAVTLSDAGDPFGYVTVEGSGSIQRDNIIPTHVELNRAMRGDASWEPPGNFDQLLKDQGRLVVRIKPERVFGVLKM